MRTLIFLLTFLFSARAMADCTVPEYDHQKINERLEKLIDTQKNIQARRRGMAGSAESTALFTAEQLLSRSVDHGLYLRPYWAIYANATATDEIKLQINQIVPLITDNSRDTASRAADFLTNMIAIVPDNAELKSSRDALRQWESSLACAR
jgi:hypothetical protein